MTSRVALLSLCLLACAQPAARPQNGVAAGKPTARAGPTVGTGGAPTAPPVTSTVQGAPAGPFHLFAEAAVADVVAGPRAALVQTDQVLEVTGEELRSIPFPPFPRGFFAQSIMVGRWPDRVFAVVTDPAQRVGTATMVMRLGGSSWTSAGVPAQDASFARGAGGEVLLLGSSSGHEGNPGLPEAQRPEPLFSAWASTGAGMDATVDSARSATGKECRTRITRAHVGTVAPDGRVIVASHECTSFTPVIASWPSNGTASFVRVPWSPNALVAIPGGKVFAAEGRRVGIFDGRTLVEEPAAPATLETLCLSASGTVWGLAGRSAWKRTAPGAWTELAAPENARVFCPHEDDDVWAATKDKVYRTKKPPRVLRDVDAKRGTGLSTCGTLFVQIAGVAASTPDSYDFPQTRAALRGTADVARLTFVVTTDGRWGAVVPDLATGERLVATLTEKLKGSKPQLFCHAPDVKRTVEIR